MLKIKISIYCLLNNRKSAQNVLPKDLVYEKPSNGFLAVHHMLLNNYWLKVISFSNLKFYPSKNKTYDKKKNK